MRVIVFAFVSILVIAGIACKPAAAPVSVSDKPVSINDIRNTNVPIPPRKPFQEMTFTPFDAKTNADGDERKLGDLAGKVVVLDFWATYCPPCLEAIPHLNDLQAKYKDNGLEIIGMHSDSDDRLKVPEFADRLKINYTLATPESAMTNFVFATDTAIPQMLILDREGKLVTRFTGYDLKIKNDMDMAIETALGITKPTESAAKNP
ncbi:MAG: TlpA family protein disulfide reductase [Pyrinomonadaceae bacterium]|nr:TlpA family protein disulfide reductase [Pyrinomonadaceae bacterium]